MSSKNPFEGFSKLNLNQRLARLKTMGALSEKDIDHLTSPHALSTTLAENFIENVIGYFHLPMGVAANLEINGKTYAIPMAVEETSIVAAVSKTAKWIKSAGKINTHVTGTSNIGQIQCAKVSDFTKFKNTVLRNKDYLIALANQDVAAGLVRRGGGVIDISIREVPRHDNASMAVIHVHANTIDAMGANILNQICEFLKAPIEQLTAETVTMCILSNLNTDKITHAEVVLDNIEAGIGEAIEEASRFAEADPYRAATHNKGVLNGIDPIVIATGNDWRAVEAGIHAYACRDGQYRAVTTWRYSDARLIGRFAAPISIGTVGGVTKLHPTAKIALNMLNVSEADELSQVIAAVGLVQNLGALRALTSVGIIQGHMKLHIANLSLSAGATAAERPLLHARLEELLKLKKRITLSNATELLDEIRAEVLEPQNVS